MAEAGLAPSAPMATSPPSAPTAGARAGQGAPGRRLAQALAGALAAVFGLRLALMLGSGAGLHVDEAQYWDWSRQLQWGYYSKPPGVAALIASSTALAGDGLLGVRLLAMLCWLACPALLAALAWQAVRQAWPADPARATRAAWWTAVLLATTPAAALLGLVATTDAPLVLCWAAMLAATAWAVQARGAAAWGAWLLAGLACGLGLLSKYTMAAWLLTWALLAWRAWRAGRLPAVAPGLALALAVAAVVLLPNLAWNAAHGWPTLRHTGDITTGAQRAAGRSLWAEWAEFAGGQLLLLGPVLVAVLVRLAWLGRAAIRATPRAMTADAASVATAAASTATAAGASTASSHWLPLRTLALDAAWPLLLLGAAQATRAHAQMNWTAPALLGLCLWAGLGAAGAGWTGRALWRCGGGALALGTAVLLWPLLTPHWPGGAPAWAQRADVWARMRGWPQAFAALRPVLDAHPGVPVVADERAVLAQAAYAWRAARRTVWAWPAEGRPLHHYQLQQALPAWPATLLWLGPQPPAAAQQARYAQWQRLAEVQHGPVNLGLWLGSQPLPTGATVDVARLTAAGADSGGARVPGATIAGRAP